MNAMTTYASLKDRVVFISGGGSGIGASLVEHFAQQGARVAFCDIDVAASVALVERLTATCKHAPHFGICNVTDIAAYQSHLRNVEAELGAIRVLVNNAGVGGSVAVEDEELERFRTSMEINVTALWHLSKLCAPSMIASGAGAIVNVASMLGHVGSTPIKQAHYCASKGAVINLTRELALQWARKGLRVNALCPGWFPSEMTEGMDTDDGGQRFIASNSPIPRMGELHELDGALLLLASPAGTFLTGQSIIVDGGWTAR